MTKKIIIKKYHKKSRLFSIVLASALMISGLSGCSVKTGASDHQETAVSMESKSRSGEDQELEDNSPKEALADSRVDMEFTDQDKDSSYDETGATKILLNGSQIQTAGENVRVSGTVVSINGGGTYLVSGTLSDGQLVIDAGDGDKVQLVLKEAKIHCETSAPLYVKHADKVFLTLADGSKNRLSGGDVFADTDGNTVDGVIFSKEDLTINGNGSLDIEANYKHGIVSKDTLAVTGGVITIDSVSQCLSGKDGIKISDGSFSLTTQGKAVKSENTDDTALGNIYVAGGQFTVNAIDDGFHASGSIVIEGGEFQVASRDDAFHGDLDVVVLGGKINVSESKEGLEGCRVTVKGGDIYVKSSDDGINAAASTDSQGENGDRDRPEDGMGYMGEPAGKTGAARKSKTDNNIYIKITGGALTVDAGGDGLDSNGSLYVEGGAVYVSGSESQGNSALDYDGNGIITGGIVVAAGSAGMAQGFTEDSTQSFILQILSETQAAGTSIKLTDKALKELAAWNPLKQYSSVLISSPDLRKGETYILTAGNETTELKLENQVVSNPQMGRKGGMGGHGRRETEGTGE